MWKKVVAEIGLEMGKEFLKQRKKSKKRPTSKRKTTKRGKRK